jgi:peptidoglycan hydrolase CwlO-like protein
MPTQEERLSTLEQTVAALNRGIWDIDHNETMLLGMAMKQDENIREVKSSLAALNEHLNTFEQRVNGRFETFELSINSRFEGQDKKFDQILLLLNTLIPKPE